MALNPFALLADLRPRVQVAHHIPGRIRLKFNSTALGYLARLKLGQIDALIAERPELHSYKLNSATGSLLLEYNAHAIAPELIDGLFHIDDTLAQNACRQLIDHLDCNHCTGDTP